MKVLIKLGGTLLDDAESRASLGAQLTEVARQHSLVVVHGGGKQVSKYLDDRGIPSRFVNGLRVSDKAVVDAVVKVISGTVNQQLVSSLLAAGASAVGLSGIDGPLTLAKQLDPALGFVGKPINTDGRLLSVLSDAGYLPVIACVAGDREGNVYNVNADQMAVSCAAGWNAVKLLFLTDVPGVKGRHGQVLSRLTLNDCGSLIADGVAHGGMQAKLEAAAAALQFGVAEVLIAPGREPGICARLLSGEPLGTTIHIGAEVA